MYCTGFKDINWSLALYIVDTPSPKLKSIQAIDMKIFSVFLFIKVKIQQQKQQQQHGISTLVLHRNNKLLDWRIPNRR
jgi:hypothetical protein